MRPSMSRIRTGLKNMFKLVSLWKLLEGVPRIPKTVDAHREGLILDRPARRGV